MYALARPLLFALDAERAHALGLRAIEAAYRTGTNPLMARRPAALPMELFGLVFDNPVGLAAGMDKNGAHIDALASLGFGYLEIGTTTPRPQAGNPKPRMYRLPEHRAVINRLGFNNDGVDVLVRNAEAARYSGVLGINIGKNADTPNERAADDYLYCLERVYPRASYITVNISSPNTRGLRELQEADALRRFVATLRERQEALAAQHGQRKAMLVKIAPDLDAAQMDAIAAVLIDAQVDGVICTNTTIGRAGIEGHRHAEQAGGLSGAPLFERSTAVLKAMAERVGAHMPLVGVGGVLSGADAAAKVQAGASLIQCYTGLVYRGPALIGESVEAIRQLAQRQA